MCCPGACLRETVKLTWKHLWPRVYSVFSETLPYRPWLMIWWFSPYPVITTMIWPTTDRIPHSLIFKRMQIKWIADNIRAFSFLLTNWYKEPHEERIYRWTEFFHKLDNKKWKMRTGARATKQNYISIYVSLYMKTFWKRVYIYIYILSVK